MESRKCSDGKLMAKDSKGNFRKFPFEELFGIEENTSYMVCSKCGYGEKEPWIPLVKACPRCGNSEGNVEKEFSLSNRAEELISKINELSDKIGREIVDPIAFNEYGPELFSLRDDLMIEMNKCAKKSFK